MTERLYLWCDTETTGLDHNTNELLEVAFILTTPDLNEERGRFESVIRPRTPNWLYDMNSFVLDMHLTNGLIEEVLRSDPAWHNASAVQSELTTWLVESALHEEPDWMNWDEQRKRLPTTFLAGSTVEFDARVLGRFMPTFFDLLHYRLINVSSVKEILLDLAPKTVNEYRNAVPKNKEHRAMADIEVSIGELRHYIGSGAIGFSTDDYTLEVNNG